jgi:ubiquinone/menaquinone biosynthesis C-methylase UbiE
MGSTDVEDFLFNATGGLDHLRDYRDGLRNGAFQVLGCLMKRPMLGDILDNEMAYIQSARQDMAKVDIPVAWICGTYDYWTNKKRIEDIMSVASPSTRVLYEVPTGHIVKTSDEAMQVFDLIVRIMWRHLFQSNITPVYPDAYLAKKANAAEWERVKRTGIDSKTYWKQYLLDKDEGKVGYDVLTFADDYSEFLDRQIALLQLEGADTVADIGGGTGSFLKSYLEKNGETGCAVATRPVRKILIVDLVWEALCKAKAKHRQLAQTASRLGVGVSYVVADTDIESPKVAIPVKSGTCSRILASLLISYLKNPQTFVDECYRILQPGGLMVMSSLKPDADMSKPITQLIEKIKSSADYISDTSLSKEDFLASAQSFMNLAASLFDLEEEMVFKFYTAEELQTLAERAGFQDIEVYGSFGDPPQALIAVARKRSSL